MTNHRPTVPEALALVPAYRREVSGGYDPLHCAMEDGNLAPHFFTLTADERLRFPSTLALASAMLVMSKTQRRKVYALAPR
jgi:hypothetical protein